MANGNEKCGCMEGVGSCFERNNYFCGKLMVERDFRAEQQYHMGKQMLHNAYLHGWGTVCCLKVDPHPNCPNLKVLVRSGMAIDCYGREIFVPEEVQVDLESYKTNGNGSTSKPRNLYICINYRECEIEPVTVFLDDCGCGEECEENRIRETYEIEVLTDNDFAKGSLPGNLYSVIVSGKKVINGSGKVDPSKGWEQFDSGKVDGDIIIRTSKASFKVKNLEKVKSVNDLMKSINSDKQNKTGVAIKYDADSDKFVLQYKSRILKEKGIKTPEKKDKNPFPDFDYITKTMDEVIILGQTGKNPFFTEIKMPAYHLEYKKVINPCPECTDNTKIILAVIEDYDKVKGDYLDPNKADFKKVAYTINNFVYRKTVPDINFIERVIHCLVKKGL
jgi:hypothetical protein